ncbi:hypothetical protein [Coralloluteibacterium thermophilus]|uniref:Glycosyltransferase family 2 protein n=1 Tax=Coralloluteibacterium thermophilum TaxID=2707049 RepID=A0ABV9NP58_9GAMM
MRIISLSTIPPRFGLLDATLDSLLRQRPRVDAVRLYVPRRYRRFPDYDGRAPAVPAGVDVVRIDDDLGPASKVLFAVREFRGTDARILFCDDDKLFAPGWAARLFDEQAARPDEAVALVGKSIGPVGARTALRRPQARRARGFDADYLMRKLRQRVRTRLLGQDVPRAMRRPVAEAGYVDVLQGLGGAVVRPHFFDATAFDIPEVLWAVDDYWLSGMLAARGVPIWLPAGMELPAPSRADDVDSLYDAVIEGVDRDGANQRCIAYMRERFGVWT